MLMMGARSLLVVVMLICMTVATLYAMNNPRQTCSKIYSYSNMKKEEKELAVANLRIAELEEELHKVDKWKTALMREQEKLMILDAARMECVSQLEEAQSNYKIGDVVSFKTSDGDWRNGTVKDRPLCILQEGQTEPECYYKNIQPPEASKHKTDTQTVTRVTVEDSKKTPDLVRHVASIAPSAKPHLEKGDAVPVVLSNGTETSAVVSGTGGVFVTYNGVEECVKQG